MIATAFTEQKFDFQLDEFYLDLQENGRRISILTPEEIGKMPFPGLRPFNTSEFQLFKGRGGQAEELLKRLKQNRFLAVIGSSGTGKSSLVRAGLIPQLFGGYLYEAGTRWNIAICRPGKNPVANLAIALSSVKGESKDKNLLYHNYETIEPMLNRSLYGLLDVNTLLNSEKTKEQQSNLLVIIDQFEEIFRYDRQDLGREKIENYFVDLLLKAAYNQKSQVYVIVTMRSEFLGDCVKYRGLPEAINEGQYLVPGLNRTQLKEVIEGPIHLAGKKISTELVEFLINEIEENKLKENLDQLPILQHALMRTYLQAGDAQEVTYAHYEKIGKMEKALANHAREKFGELGAGGGADQLSKKQQIAKIIFQALTDANSDLKGGRRPTELRYIYTIAQAVGATKTEVNEVVNKFRDEDTSFIMPPVNTVLHDDMILDISHESLMRNWDLLKTWVEEEVRNGRLYNKLDERRKNNDQWIPDLVLQEMLLWRDKQPHNAAWAIRYHNLPKSLNDPSLSEDIYRKNIDFLNECQRMIEEDKEGEKKRAEEEMRKKSEDELRKQREKSRKMLLAMLTAGLCIAVALALMANQQRKNAYRAQQGALAFADSLDNERQTAQQSRDEARTERDNVRKLKEEIERQADTLRTANSDLEDSRRQIEAQKDDLANQVVEHDLHKEKFFKLNILDTNTKEAICDMLFLRPLAEHKKLNLRDFINKELLDDINEAVQVRELFASDPITGLRAAKLSWEKRREMDTVTKNILFEIFKQNIFYKQRINASFYQREEVVNKPISLSAKGGPNFNFAISDQIVAGRFSDDSIAIENVVWPTYSPANFLTGDSISQTPFENLASPIIALGIDGNNSFLSLHENRDVFRVSGSRWEKLVTLPGLNRKIAKFSPAGKLLATISQNNVLEVWKTDSFNKVLKPMFDTANVRNIRQLLFSPDEKQLVVVFFDNRFDIWDLQMKTKSDKFGKNRRGIPLVFRNNSDFLMLDPPNSNIQLINIEGREFFTSAREIGFSLSQINEMDFSPDWKSLIVNVSGELYLLKTTNSDSIFVISGTPTYLTSKKLFSSPLKISNARYLNQNTVMALSPNGAILLWDIKTPYHTFEAAFKSVKTITDLTHKEKEKIDLYAFDKVLMSKNRDQFREAASYYFENASDDDIDGNEREIAVDRAKQLYLQLAKNDNDFLLNIDSFRLQQLREKKIVDKRPAIDTLALISRLIGSISEGERLLPGQTKNNNFLNQLSLDYWNLSWYHLFYGNNKAAIQAAKKGFKLYPLNDGINTNLALGYLLNGEFVAAEDIYKRYKDRYYASRARRRFNDAFLEDFRDLEKAGIITKNKPEIYNEVQRIKKEILGVKE